MIRIRVLSTLILYLVVYFTVLTLRCSSDRCSRNLFYRSYRLSGCVSVFNFWIFRARGTAHGTRHGTARAPPLLSYEVVPTGRIDLGPTRNCYVGPQLGLSSPNLNLKPTSYTPGTVGTTGIWLTTPQQKCQLISTIILLFYFSLYFSLLLTTRYLSVGPRILLLLLSRITTSRRDPNRKSKRYGREIFFQNWQQDRARSFLFITKWNGCLQAHSFVPIYRPQKSGAPHPVVNFEILKP